MKSKLKRKQTKIEEIVNSISHGLMIPVSIWIFIIYYRLLIKKNYFHIYNILPLFLFTFTMLLLYIMSCLYHAFSFTRFRILLQKLDHVCIYLLIWGSFTPFLLVNIPVEQKMSFLFSHKSKIIFIIQTFLVLFGILGELFYFKNNKRIHLFLYFCLGWNGLICIKDLLSLSWIITFFLLLGGFIYSIGVFFYSKSSNYKYYHFIWHIFVILGNLSHIYAIYNFINIL
ncbi:hemolysin-III related family protein [Candidatus Phytoplasma oryzae]|nr:hemolysin III family protein [Candidatus Phytoplasma oryzae]KXT29101.1 hemolysin-III related family protein [Candidatus Phytoplasma oryzae]KXT29154.1 hemolysin-III related family protein [Candidatus Phytoplasma oryzae]